VLDTVPFGQPALSLADQLQRRAERAGAPADLAALPARERGPATGSGSARESGPAGESGPVMGSGPVTGSGPAAGDGFAGGASADEGDGPAGEQAVSAIGAELFALVARAREAGLDPELELRAAARAYRDRVRAWELSERG
jgi:XTP/dITP diphosphohydrolase